MEQELISKSVAIIGGGPAGCCCAYFLNDYNKQVTIFDKGSFLSTILPTGGGRCNFANAIYDFKKLAQNYPRGEKFLYSVFSKFSTQDTVQMFNKIGIKSYTQDDNRIFPLSNSSHEVRTKLLKALNCNFVNEKVILLKPLKNGYKLVTNKSEYFFDIVVIAIGGHSDFEILKKININTIPPVKSLVGLTTDKNFSSIAGVSLKNIEIKLGKKILTGDIIFTHKGISGPLIYTISSLKAKDSFPYTLNLKIASNIDLQKKLNQNPHKNIKNLLSEFIPKSLSQWILDDLNISDSTKCHLITSKTRDSIANTLANFQIKITGTTSEGEVVTCGGIDLNEINSKTMESKKYPNLYYCGEVIDVDGLCGGFNLQNCWSTGYVVAHAIKEHF